MSNINDLKVLVDVVRRSFKEAEARYNAALIEEYPLKVGDVIRSSSGKIARVENVFVKWGSVHVFATLRDAGGTFGRRAARMGARGWENPEKISP